ncbi:MAG: cytochrome c-type biogenesis protein CcmH [Solirubrobacterales bacterium]|nr:cytochrome c-type biogenesis protein CcmH [Solirubrobacterales bacterium]
MIRTALALSLALLLACSAAPLALAATAHPRASLTDIENDVMCTSCREPLAVAQSPQADSERAYIRGLIAQGLTKQQIEQNLVSQYGESVLGKPPASGFNLAVYILPPAILAVGVAILAVTLPRWRRRAQAAADTPSTSSPAFDPAEAARLEQDLSQFRG